MSELVLVETERNLARKAPRALAAFDIFREMLAQQIVYPSKELVEDCLLVVASKDAPIVAGARAAEAAWIVSYDQKHLLNQHERIRECFGILVATPEEYLSG